ncbi:MAG TPA: hypothetical protein VMF14_07540 [Solirubrobacteraceae bacterium]|nr:hypothetical protein [Solirubrobacteraceae bacterium]
MAGLRETTPLSVGILCLAVALVLNALLRHQVGFSGDEPYYSRIAAHPSGPHNFPYAFRIGLPYLVHVLPLAQSFSWEALALVCAGAAGGALFALLGEFDVPAPLALGLAVGLTVSPPLLVVFLRNGREVDAAAILILMLGSYFIVRRRLVPLAVTLLVGATIHEACLFLIPLAYAVWADRWFDRSAARDLALVAAVPIIGYIILRATIVAVGEQYQPGYQGAFIPARIDVLKTGLEHGAWHEELRRIALSFGPLWLAAPFSILRVRFTRRGLVLVALSACAMTFALDWGRMIFFAAPVIYVAAAYTLRARRRLAVAAVLALLAMDAGYAIYMQVHGVKSSLDSNGPPARGPVAWIERSSERAVEAT